MKVDVTIQRLLDCPLDGHGCVSGLSSFFLHVCMLRLVACFDVADVFLASPTADSKDVDMHMGSLHVKLKWGHTLWGGREV